MTAPRVLVAGGAGFIGMHLTKALKQEGFWVRAVDIKRPEWGESEADEFAQSDLRIWQNAADACEGIDWVFQLAADMGGMGFISKYHAEIIRNNTMINVNMIESARAQGIQRYLFSSSACVYPQFMQDSPKAMPLAEEDAYPADPQDAYGWEKLHGEHLCRYYRDAGWLDTKVVRFHNCYGTKGAWRGEWDEDKQDWSGGREKAPAAMCRKVAVAKLKGTRQVEIWGDGTAVRSYMWIDDCVTGIMALMESPYSGPLNIGSSQAISVDGLVDLISYLAGITVEKAHIDGPVGVQWRNSDNTLCHELLGWEPDTPLEYGLLQTYHWIEEQARAGLEDHGVL